jgi:hypothetical protein
MSNVFPCCTSAGSDPSFGGYKGGKSTACDPVGANCAERSTHMLFTCIQPGLVLTPVLALC